MKTYLTLLCLSVALVMSAQTTQLCSNFYCIDGNHAIGTTVTNGYKLAVKGKVIAEELKVQVFPWADFVFEENYRLPTLAEVAQYIEKNGHLPNIPSALEVDKNGINVGEMDAKLLQKIEELTLYILEKEHKIKQQRMRLEKLEASLTQQN